MEGLDAGDGIDRLALAALPPTVPVSAHLLLRLDAKLLGVSCNKEWEKVRLAVPMGRSFLAESCLFGGGEGVDTS